MAPTWIIFLEVASVIQGCHRITIPLYCVILSVVYMTIKFEFELEILTKDNR